MRPPSGHSCLLNQFSTAKTRQALSSIDLMKTLKPSAGAIGPSIIPQGGSLFFNSLVQDFLDNPMEICKVGRGKRFDPGHGMDGGLEQGFIDVNISQPGDDRLIQKQGFNGPVFGHQDPDKLAGGYFERIGTQVVPIGRAIFRACLHQVPEAEFSDVPVAELPIGMVKVKN